MNPSTDIRPEELPWEHTIGLLLDALHVENLIQSIYEWSTVAPQVEVLYRGTQWAEIGELSPCLVRLNNAVDPVLKQFLDNSRSHWGYLLVSDAPWSALVAHLRWLTSIEPPSGEATFLRISSTSVAHALFAEENKPDARVFGPCQQVIAATIRKAGWRCYARSGDIPSPSLHTPCQPDRPRWDSPATNGRRPL